MARSIRSIRFVVSAKAAQADVRALVTTRKDRKALNRQLAALFRTAEVPMNVKGKPTQAWLQVKAVAAAQGLKAGREVLATFAK